MQAALEPSFRQSSAAPAGRAQRKGEEMTHSGGKPHTNIGDRGQRYEVRATGYPKRDSKAVIGWASTLEGAEEIAAAIREAPGCTSTEIFDREENKPVITRFAGILR
jgi:hypothetical protein